MRGFVQFAVATAVTLAVLVAGQAAASAATAIEYGLIAAIVP